MPVDEILIWQQYIRDYGTPNEIMIRGFLANLQIHSIKSIKAESLFPHLREFGADETIAEQVKARMRQIKAVQKEQGKK